MSHSYICEFLENEGFVDFHSTKSSKIESIDVIIPIQNTNAFFLRNLISIFREIPVNRLIVGDGGSVDESLRILSKFPRVEVRDHSKMQTLGGSLRDLIMAVQTPKFAYLHSDVYLPQGFYEKLNEYDLKNSWLESNRVSLLVHEDINDRYFTSERSYSGAQFGDSELLKRAIFSVEDDFLSRVEDIIISELVIRNGGKYSKAQNLRHLHQTMSKNLENEPKITVQIGREKDSKWEANTQITAIKGIIKYTDPKVDNQVSYVVKHVNISLEYLETLGALEWGQLIEWTSLTKPEWLPFLKRPLSKTTRFKRLIYILRDLMK